MIKKSFVLGVILTIAGAAGFSQENGALFLLEGVGQSSVTNPAFQNQNENLIVGLPLLSGIQAHLDANFSVNSIFSEGLSTYSLENFYNSLGESGNARFSGKLSMFFASLKQGDWNYNFSFADRAFAKTKFDREIIKLINTGNFAYYGTSQDFGAGSFHFTYFRELAAGVSFRYWKELDIGIRPKFLFGRSYFNAQDVNFSVETDVEEEELHLKPEGEFTLSAPLTINYDSTINFTTFSAAVLPGDYFLNFRNLGFALDFGLVFRPNRLTEISASVLDLGFVGFRHNTFNAEFSRPVKYSINTLFQSYDPENGGLKYIEPKESLKAFGDSVSYIITANDLNVRKLVALPLKINLAGKYKISETFKIGVSNQLVWYGSSQAFNNLSGFAHKWVNEKLELVGSLSVYNFSGIRIGFGGSYTANFVQFFATSNNILGIVRPTATNDLNLCFGVNLLFATKN